MNQTNLHVPAAPARRLHGMRCAKTAASLAGVAAAYATFTWSGFAWFVGVVLVCGMGVTVGYHRLLTHNGFKTYRPLRWLWALLGCMTGQGGPLSWVATHRIHHGNADRELDPHSPTRGFWWAQIGWTLFRREEFDNPVRRRRYVPDLIRDPGLRLIERFEWLVPVGLCAALYALGEIWGVGLSWAVWGGSMSMTVLYHSTSLINSACHLWGYRSHDTREGSTNFPWLCLINYSGENWHNNHHAFPRSSRHGLAWWEIDAGWWVVSLQARLGLAWDVLVFDGEKYAVRFPRAKPRPAPVMVETPRASEPVRV